MGGSIEGARRIDRGKWTTAKQAVAAAILALAGGGDAVGERHAPQPGAVFRDCPDCPEMVVVPAGAFTMGSPETEKDGLGSEGPQRKVSIAKPFALGKHEVTRGEWASFVRATGHAASGGCHVWSATARKWGLEAGADWSKPGFAQTDRHPALCVNWHDAKAYAAWLARATDKAYRLPSEAEWEYAARAGTTTRYAWGDNEAIGCQHANGADASANTKFTGSKVMPCDDGHAYTAPVGSYARNAFGLHDMVGNVAEWLEDCWHGNFAGAPIDGSAWVVGGDCSLRVIRGGSWIYNPWGLRIAIRDRYGAGIRSISHGFRVARTLD